MSNNDVSGCNAQVILFLTDGEITAGTTQIVELIENLKSNTSNEGIEFKILTYGIGDDLDESDLSVLKDISCNNDGIFYEIGDITDDLSYTMASYYQLFVSLRDTSDIDEASVIWIDFLDGLTGYRLISANLPVYDKTTNPYTLLGVVVSDVAAERIIDSEASSWGTDVGIYDDFDEIFSDMLTSSKQCPSLDYDYTELESIRSSISDSGICGVRSEDSSSNETNWGRLWALLWVFTGFCAVFCVLVAVLQCKEQRKKRKASQETKEKNWVQSTGEGRGETFGNS